MLKLLRTITVLLTLFISFALVPVAFAHPLGNFTINQYVGLKVGRERILIDYVLDMAEIPAFQEIAVFDLNGNSQPDDTEFAGYPADKCTTLQHDLHLLLNNKPLALTLTSSSVEFPDGVGGLPTLRLTCEYQTTVDFTNTAALSLVNDNFPERLGWREIVVIPDHVTLAGEYPATSQSSRLTKYPQDLQMSPLDQRQVELHVMSMAVTTDNKTPLSAKGDNSPLTDANDAFTRLILLDEITFPTLLLALAISFIWGGMHALTPGHGKTVVGAYLVGSRGTMKHAVYLGLTTTITHTLGVFALGLLTLFAAHYIVPEKLYPWLSMLSGLFVLGIGFSLFAGRLKSLKPVTRPGNNPRVPAAYATAQQLSRAAGINPSQRYILQGSHGHSHYHDHSHGHPLDHNHQPHDHAGHSHTPPETVTWRSLLALGVSGGLIPCPSALVVLLGAVALNMIGLGLVLVLAFSLGLASALTVIGMLFIYAGKLFQRVPLSGKAVGLLPVVSALFVSMIGIGITIKSLMEIGSG